MGNFFLRWTFFYFVYLESIMSIFRITEAIPLTKPGSSDVRILSNSSCSDVNVLLLSQSCNFNTNYCTYSHPTSYNSIRWMRKNEKSLVGVDSLHDGGSFLYPYMLGKPSGASSSVNTTTISGGTVCIQFWYVMAYSASNLEVLVDTHGDETSVMKLTGGHGHQWRKATIAVSSQAPFKVFIAK
ncbi:MAM and LDL-receptor class A domain-containing protein 1-like [Ylistrum balloti]|uniref:MAM and LDL-receptor class A domain-containing protein 1-like n=1 Tax=Ylistrum balloti TaxID=509963 RepID=UPI002905835E|nr:MAM and LDL-receptor class A domain-containing protein 1-like [Ylistrum balloti]